MLIVEDSRQQANKHEIKHRWFEENGVELVRCKLIFGDYTTLNKVYVDTKANMGEIAQNIGGASKEHTRFRNELKLAQAFNKKLYVLVENTEDIHRLSEVQYWKNPRRGAITGLRLCKAMDTMQQRYGVTFLFCAPEESGKVIVKLLERDE